MQYNLLFKINNLKNSNNGIWDIDDFVGYSRMQCRVVI